MGGDITYVRPLLLWREDGGRGGESGPVVSVWRRQNEANHGEQGEVANGMARMGDQRLWGIIV